jgi:hypothetical protein
MARIGLQRHKKKLYVYIYKDVYIYFTSPNLIPFIFYAHVLVTSLGVYAEVR